MDDAGLSRVAGRHLAAVADSTVFRADSAATVGLAHLSRHDLRRVGLACEPRRTACAGATLPTAVAADRRGKRSAWLAADADMGFVGLADCAVPGNHGGDDLDLCVHPRVFGAMVRLLLSA